MGKENQHLKRFLLTCSPKKRKKKRFKRKKRRSKIKNIAEVSSSSILNFHSKKNCNIRRGWKFLFHSVRATIFPLVFPLRNISFTIINHTKNNDNCYKCQLFLALKKLLFFVKKSILQQKSLSKCHFPFSHSSSCLFYFTSMFTL